MSSGAKPRHQRGGGGDMKKEHVDLREKLNALRAAKSAVPPRTNSDKSHCPEQLRTKPRADRVCPYWMADKCFYGEKCRFLHSWFLGDGVTRLAQLRGHKKGVSGIVLPSASDKLFTGSCDGTLRAWDCSTGQCDDNNVFNMGTEVGSVLCQGPWVFIGVLNIIRAWNIQTSVKLNLIGAAGRVHAMAFANETLFAACQNGDVLAWKPCPETKTFELIAKLSGHSKAALSLAVAGDKIYSGSADNTIRVWDCNSQHVQILTGHSGTVTSLICWGTYLISGSLDGTIKVWLCKEDGNTEEIYTHKEQVGILALNGISGADSKPILLASCADRSVHLYELPSFNEYGKLFTKEDVRSIHVASEGGLIFTGDGSGNVDVWKWLGQSTF